MRITQSIMLVLLMAIGLFSCKKTETVETDVFEYLIFGSYAGECIGECATIYKLTGDMLYVDDMEYYTQDISFNSTALSQAQFDIAEVLRTEFPVDILAETEDTFGCPDCYDQGGYIVEWKTNAITKRWHLDTTEEDIPAYLAVYTQRIGEIMMDLQ